MTEKENTGATLKLAPIWSGRIPPPVTLGGRSITWEMIRETEEELGLREIIDAGVEVLLKGDHGIAPESNDLRNE